MSLPRISFSSSSSPGPHASSLSPVVLDGMTVGGRFGFVVVVHHGIGDLGNSMVEVELADDGTWEVVNRKDAWAFRTAERTVGANESFRVRDNAHGRVYEVQANVDRPRVYLVPVHLCQDIMQPVVAFQVHIVPNGDWTQVREERIEVALSQSAADVYRDVRAFADSFGVRVSDSTEFARVWSAGMCSTVGS